MPTLNESNVRHLLRRTEFVDRSARVAHLLSLGSMEAAVDDVMAVDANPPSASLTAPDDWTRGVQLAEHWLDRMAWAPKPFGERMALFWHGHLVSDYVKAYGAEFVQEQIDLYRRTGLGNVGTLVKNAAVQVVMLRYLDNCQNFAESPNQNWAREMMELFLLGVGNYNEDDVEAATAAWTGHRADRPGGVYYFDASRHDNTPQSFLGRTVNAGSGQAAGQETIDVILYSGVVPADALRTENRGRPTRDVSAEFLTKKLWQEFGEADSGGVPAGVGRAMRSALLSTNFEIRPWVRAMLLHDDFYATATRTGLVRQPIEYSVACSVATTVPSNAVGQLWLMKRAGQQPFFSPDVSGWKPNGYWVNASAIGARNRLALGCMWNRLSTWWAHDWFSRNLNYVDLARGRLHQHEVFGWDHAPQMSPMDPTTFVDRLIALTDLRPSANTRSRLIGFCGATAQSHWMNALMMLLLAPEMNVA